MAANPGKVYALEFIRKNELEEKMKDMTLEKRNLLIETIAKQWKRQQEEHEAEVGRSEKKRLEKVMEGMDWAKRSLLMETIANREKRQKQGRQEGKAVRGNDLHNQLSYPDQAMRGVLVETFIKREHSTNDSVKIATPRSFDVSKGRRFGIKKDYKSKGTSISGRQGFGSQGATCSRNGADGGTGIITLRFSKPICDQFLMESKSYQASFSVETYR